MAEMLASLDPVAEGTVKLTAEALLNVLGTGQKLGHHWDACVVSAVLRGSTTPKKDFIKFSAQFVVRVNDVPTWATVKLLPATMTVLSMDVKPEAQAHVVPMNAYHCLLTRTAGTYTVAIEANFPLEGKHKSHVSFWLPNCACTDLTFVVTGRENVQITAEPSLDGSMVSEGDTTFHALIPPTELLCIRWTEPLVAAAAAIEPKGEAAPLSITVDQQHLFSVGEGMLLSSTRFKYDIRNGVVSVFPDIRIDSRLRILSVESAYLSRWEVVATSSKQAAAATAVVEHSNIDAALPSLDEKNAASSALADHTLSPFLRITLNQNVGGSHEIFIESELELDGTTCTFACPVFAHVQDQVISREQGYIAIEARTNVEVDQPECAAGCMPIDIGELNEELRQTAAHPLLLAYKFLQPSYELSLSVQRHGDVSVCVALVEAAAFTLTATEQGRVMKRLVLKVRNSARQYVRVYLSSVAGYELWSTSVAGKAVKPATDGQAVMIPLKKESRPGARQAAFVVELVWVDAPQPAMTVRGQLDFELPKLDLPINQLFVSVYLPSEYRYGEFTGDLLECRKFSVSPPSSAAAEIPVLPGSMMPGSMIMSQSQAAYQPMSFLDNDSDDICFGAAPPPPPQQQQLAMKRQESIEQLEIQQSYAPMKSAAVHKKGKQQFGAAGRGKAGVVPVQIEMVTAGRLFMFERLLLTPDEESLHASVPYKRKSDGAIQAHV